MPIRRVNKMSILQFHREDRNMFVLRRNNSSINGVLVVLLMILLLACSSQKHTDNKNSQDGPVDSNFKIVGGRLTTEPPWVVGLLIHSYDIDGQNLCTGIVLTNKWILTAGHCFDNISFGQWTNRIEIYRAPSPGTRAIIYSGPGVFKKHRDLDVALLFLSKPTGLGSTFADTGQAKVFFDRREPWVNPKLQSDRAFAAVGWGRTKNGTWICNSGPYLVMRVLRPLYINVSGPGETVHVNRGDQEKLCGGDSGAPWLLERSGELMSFAVYSETDLFVFPPRPVDRAILIKPIINWFTEASNRVSSYFTLYYNLHTANGWKYITFKEVDKSPPPPCPNGQICCSYTPKGYCWQCIAPTDKCGNNPFRGCGENQMCCEPGIGPTEGCRKCVPKWATGCP